MRGRGRFTSSGHDFDVDLRAKSRLVRSPHECSEDLTATGYEVAHYPARADVPEGYELEVFAASGQTIAVVSVPASAVREATEHEILSVREIARA